MIEGYISHISPGRLRLKFPSAKGEENFFSSFLDNIKQAEYFKNIKVNPTIGSILIEHEKTTEEVIGILKDIPFVKIRKYEENPSKKISQSLSKSFSHLNKIIKKISSGKVDLKSTVLLFLLISALYQIARGNLSSIPWYTALFYLNSLISKE